MNMAMIRRGLKNLSNTLTQGGLDEAVSLGVAGAVNLATGTIYWVDGTNGNNNYDGLSWDRAKKTIAAAVAKAVAGDTILCKGSFSEAVTVSTDSAGSAQTGLRLIGLGTNTAEATWTAAADATCLTITSVSHVQVSGFRFRPPAYSAGTPAAIRLNNAPYTQITDNRFQGKTGSYYAIFCTLNASYSSDNVVIARNKFLYLNNVTTVNGSAIVSTASDGGYSCSSWEILDNEFQSCVIGIDVNCRHSKVMGNVFYESGLAAAGTLGTVCTTKIDLSGTSSGCNFVTGNYFDGDYSHTGGYVEGATADCWVGNFAEDVSEDEVGDNAITLSVPT